MNKTTSTETQNSDLASKDWVMKELMDTERRFEKAFHEQTRFLGEKSDSFQEAVRQQIAASDERHQTTTRWMVGLMLTMIIAVVVAVLLK